MARAFSKFLIAVAAVAALAAPAAAANSYYFRTKPLVDAPKPFSFAAGIGVTPGVAVTSATAQVSGHGGETASVTGGEYQVCASADCSDQTSWKTAPTSGLPSPFYARVRVAAPAFGTSATATLTVGSASAPFDVSMRDRDTTPKVIAFTDKTGATAGQYALSEIKRLEEHDGVNVSVVGSGIWYRICADATCSADPTFVAIPGTAATGTYIQLRATAPSVGPAASFTLNYGTLQATWSVKSAAVPAGFGITDTGLSQDLVAALGAGEWTQCNNYGTGGTASCSGAPETLVLFANATKTAWFGVYAPIDIYGLGACNTWSDKPGWFFTNVKPASGYLFKGNGDAGVTNSRVAFCGRSAASGLYGLDSTTATGFTTMNNGIPWEWKAPFTLTGGNSGAGVGSLTLKWFRRG